MSSQSRVLFWIEKTCGVPNTKRSFLHDAKLRHAATAEHLNSKKDILVPCSRDAMLYSMDRAKFWVSKKNGVVAEDQNAFSVRFFLLFFTNYWARGSAPVTFQEIFRILRLLPEKIQDILINIEISSKNFRQKLSQTHTRLMKFR